MSTGTTIKILTCILVIIWLLTIVSVFNESTPSKHSEIDNLIENHSTKTAVNDAIKLNIDSITTHKKHIGTKQNLHPNLPKRYSIQEEFVEPASLDEIKTNITLYLTTLHNRLGALAGPNVDAAEVWDEYLDTTKSLLMKWDDQNRHRFPKPRNDKSIFVSLGTYRDPYCPMTLKSLYSQAEHPERLFVGLLQQNCFEEKCRTGVLKGGIVETMGKDDDCYQLFCASPEGKRSGACNTGQVRLYNVNESESLGPYMARYLGAKFYRGENYYLQIDSHSQFVQNWDSKLIRMVETAEAKKPVISTYPPDSTFNWKDSIGFRMCDSEFAKAQIEWQIIRLGSSMTFDSFVPKTPRYAPFVAAGFFFSWGGFLHEVPFDPLLPWIFMGEEISMSARLWTAGYDIFSPTTNVLNHYYVRRHYPKFWETVNRFFKKPIHNNLVEIVLKRVKAMLQYPESTSELLNPNSVLYRLEDWSMGTKRSLSDYMDMVGINVKDKIVQRNNWCHSGEWPKQAEQYRIKK
jgi:[Skp1-protein]-hydroxyproline N-acetylglucosaminyltransferase